MSLDRAAEAEAVTEQVPGPEAVAGDKFRLGELFNTGALLFGRRTWQQFSRLWPARDDAFSTLMNTVPKLVASRTLARVDEWQNSQLLQGDLVDEVVARKATQDLIVVGSASIAKALIAHDLVDEFRLKLFPLVIGTGTRLFDDGTLVGPLITDQAAERMAQALERARAAVAAFRITGPKTNLLFHADLLTSTEFVGGDYDTSLVSKLRPR